MLFCIHFKKTSKGFILSEKKMFLSEESEDNSTVSSFILTVIPRKQDFDKKQIILSCHILQLEQSSFVKI